MDDGPSGKIIYSLDLTDDDEDGEALDVFSIDPETGWISTKTGLDREMVAAYTLVVLAIDGGKAAISFMMFMLCNKHSCHLLYFIVVGSER